MSTGTYLKINKATETRPYVPYTGYGLFLNKEIGYGKKNVAIAYFFNHS